MTTPAPAASDSNLADSQALTLRAAQTVANSIIQLQDQAFMIAGAYEVAGNTTVNCANATAHSRACPGSLVYSDEYLPPKPPATCYVSM